MAIITKCNSKIESFRCGPLKQLPSNKVCGHIFGSSPDIVLKIHFLICHGFLYIWYRYLMSDDPIFLKLSSFVICVVSDVYTVSP